MNSEFTKIVVWLECNKHSLNVSKTHYQPLICENLEIRGEYIQWGRKTKFLGTDIAKGLGIICKAKKLLNSLILCILYHCFVYPYLDYYIEVWGDSFKTYMQTLVSLQREVQRIITHSKYNVCVDQLSKTIKILEIKKIHVYKVATFCYPLFMANTVRIWRSKRH